MKDELATSAGAVFGPDTADEAMDGANDSLLSFRLRILPESSNKGSSSRGGSVEVVRRLRVDRFVAIGVNGVA